MKKEKLPFKEKFKKEFKSIVLIIVGVLAFRASLFEPFKIPSGSMIPTLMIGDFILVNKFSYGFKLPFSHVFGNPIYLTKPKNPERGDVIVFKYPKETSLNYIKRVVGLPGETVEVKDKIVFINDQPISTQAIDGSKIMEDMDEKYKYFKLDFFRAQTGNRKHIIQLHEDSFYTKDFPKVTIPEGHFFVMGDNRDFSADSREWGFVPFYHIKGKALLVWFSFIVPWPWVDDSFKMRIHRIGNIINQDA